MGDADRALREGSDEADRAPVAAKVTILDIITYVLGIAGHVVDLGVDVNVAVQYYLAARYVYFGCTLALILVPAFVTTAISVRMYAQDKSQEDSISIQVTRIRVLRIFILVLQMAPVLRYIDALVYALKCRAAAKNKDLPTQRLMYRLMLKEDSDAALLRIFECFLEAAPQQVLQMSLLFRMEQQFTVHQALSITSSILSMGWCLASYQRAVRYAQEDKLNVDWFGSLLQTLWHFLITFSRITSVAIIAYLYPYYCGVAILVHVFIMTCWLQLYDRSPFCAHNRCAELAFSLAMGAVYIFTYILPVEGPTRYRYSIFYTLCFLENWTCAQLWYFYAVVMRGTFYFVPVIVLSIAPYMAGLMLMVLYYLYFHPRVRKSVPELQVTVKMSEVETADTGKERHVI